MPSVRVSGSRYFTLATAVFAVFGLASGLPRAHGQTNDKTPSISPQNEVPFQLKVTSNLVVVRVVVRDAQGKPVEDLKKEDFKLFDRGKQQTITQFDAETSVLPPSNAGVVRVPEQTVPPAAAVPPGRFIAFYFDDLNTSDADMIQARDAADHYLTANLQPQDRVAIFTTEQVSADFGADPEQLHDALFKLHVNARALTRIHQCPDLSDYQSLEITQNQMDQTSDAWRMALDEAVNRCHMPTTDAPMGDPQAKSSAPPPPSPTVDAVRNLARTIVAQSEMQTRTTLQGLEQVVNIVSRAPGRRSIILVSPGFLSQTAQHQVDQIIDRALRSEVVISSVDPRGLALLLRDASQSFTPSATAIAAMNNTDSAREAVATNVLAEIAHGTGGEFFHNNNDLKGGFGALAGSPAYYILAFTPTHIKPDGKFHALKITLAEKGKGIDIQARSGYFALENEGERAPESTGGKQSGSQEMGSSDSQAQAHEEILEAVPLKTEIAQPPVRLDTKQADGQAGTRGLALSADMDGSPLNFHKVTDHNPGTMNTEAERLYAGAQPYMDEPLPKLKKAVHELKGLEPAPSQEQLSGLLAKVGAKADELTKKVPNLISDEEVSESQWDAAEPDMVPGCDHGCLTEGSHSHRDQSFSYLILTHLTQSGQKLDEYRTGRNGRPISEVTGAPSFQGFVSAWIVFSSVNQVESRFRYLGQQQTSGHNTYVIGFAQIPGSVKFPGSILTSRGPVPMLLQGVAWIDQSDLRIVRMRTDLLAPLPEIQHQRQTANILFGAVHIANLESELWLPQEVDAEMEAKGQFLQEKHKYSKYRVYQVNSRIILSPVN